MIRFTLNGREVIADGFDPHTTLLWFLRERGLTGTKEGCAEGECGACAVAVVRAGLDGRARYDTVNSCLVPLATVADREVITVEGIAGERALHPVQKALVERGGSQCGYCTPGFVVSMFTEHYRRGRDGYDPEAVGGNLCRCTGYRPIREAVAALPAPDPDDPFQRRLDNPPPRLAAVRHEGGGARFYRPSCIDEALSVLADEPGARLVAGGTDVFVEANLRHARWDAIVSLEDVPELRVFESRDDALVLGAGLPLSFIEEEIGDEPRALAELFPLFSSRLIRNRATLGGNLVNASPIGDGPPVLLALDAEVVLASRRGRRTVPLDGFFTAYRETALAPGELLVSVRIPRPFPALSRFFKVSKRVLDDISTVAAAFAFDLDGDVVTRARLAYGGVAATPLRAKDAEAALVGRPLTPQTVAEVRPLLEACFTPIGDHRGSAAYRKAMVGALLDKLVHEEAS